MSKILVHEKTVIQPCLGNVLLRRQKAHGESIGRIALPDSARMPFERFEVVAIGPGELTITGQRLPMPCEVGNIVLAYGTPRYIRVDGEELELVAHTDIQAVVSTVKD